MLKWVYYHLCQAFDVGHNSRDINLNYEQFLQGSTIWAWTLSPDMDANNSVGLLQKPGNFTVDIYVKSGHTTNPALTALFLGKFSKSVPIGSENSVSLQWFQKRKIWLSHLASRINTEFLRGHYAAMTFNTDYSNEPGEHWVSVFINGCTQEAFIFDSFPIRPFPQSVMKQVANKTKFFIFSKKYSFSNNTFSWAWAKRKVRTITL